MDKGYYCAECERTYEQSDLKCVEDNLTGNYSICPSCGENGELKDAGRCERCNGLVKEETLNEGYCIDCVDEITQEFETFRCASKHDGFLLSKIAYDWAERMEKMEGLTK